MINSLALFPDWDSIILLELVKHLEFLLHIFKTHLSFVDLLQSGFLLGFQTNILFSSPKFFFQCKVYSVLIESSWRSPVFKHIVINIFLKLHQLIFYFELWTFDWVESCLISNISCQLSLYCKNWFWWTEYHLCVVAALKIFFFFIYSFVLNECFV